MARKAGPQCRLCRREGTKLYLKGARCDTVKCGVARREYAPGMRTWRRSRFSEYGQQLREKQKVKRYYGLLERQFRRFFDMAERMKGNTGENLLILLERRLDNAVHRLGFALDRRHARQFIAHGHIAVNGKKTTIPSALIKPGDVITPLRQKDVTAVQTVMDAVKSRTVPTWLEATDGPPAGKVLDMPKREEIDLDIREQLIVEFSSK